VFWPGLQSLWWGTDRSRGWYFPDVLRDRQVWLACPGIVLLLGVGKPGRVSTPYFFIVEYSSKVIE